ncbi:DUF4394 domain-containing protein [Aeromicrobium sp. NPDC092404]|uniref:DUF4394 domain-containing protein n=1 Tax=Aeromicrobium sp. NPDC092404 TaxID=3154976 RepID=UPI00342E4C9F
MRHRLRSLVAAGAAVALGLGASVGLAGTASAASSNRALGLSSNGKTLSVVNLDTAKRTAGLGNVTGLSGDAKLVGIDFRVQDRRFYGVGNAGGVYVINSYTGKATKVSQLSVELDWNMDFAVDFNPAADRLRVISSGGQNLRHDVNTDTTTTDTPLAYNPAGATPAVTAVAYTNNDLDAANTATTLFDIDTTTDFLAVQSPANAGTLVNEGKLGFDAAPAAGFDIRTTVVNGRAVANSGWAALRPAGGGASALYRIDLSSGKATKVGSFIYDVADLAVTQP